MQHQPQSTLETSLRQHQRLQVEFDCSGTTDILYLVVWLLIQHA